MSTPNLRIKLVRESLGMLQKEMAKVLHMSASSYNQIETGRNNVSPRVVALLSVIYNVNEQWLLDGQGHMFVKGKPSDHSESIRIAELQEELDRYKKLVDVLMKKL
jgi:transcriptional regulator with XRE-family HTH domain